MGAINEMLDYDSKHILNIQETPEDNGNLFSYDNRFKELEKFKTQQYSQPHGKSKVNIVNLEVRKLSPPPKAKKELAKQVPEKHIKKLFVSEESQKGIVDPII